MARVELATIPALTFYQDSVTLSRRTSPIPQLVCVGKACNLYQPEVVRCENIGGGAADIDWKCEADLPASLRFGRVEVSCEGWSGPGDSYVLKGSCGLEYRLVQVPKALRDDAYPHVPSWFQTTDIGGLLFGILWLGVLLFIAYGMLKSCFGRNSNSGNSTPRPPGTSPGGSPWFPGGYRDNGSNAPPPPYSKSTPDSSQSTGWRPGFWTGAALGGLAGRLSNRGGQTRQETQRPVSYDWERGRSQMPRPGTSYDNRGEGSSNLGAMRRSTGLGGSNVR